MARIAGPVDGERKSSAISRFISLAALRRMLLALANDCAGSMFVGTMPRLSGLENFPVKDRCTASAMLRAYSLLNSSSEIFILKSFSRISLCLKNVSCSHSTARRTSARLKGSTTRPLASSALTPSAPFRAPTPPYRSVILLFTMP